MLKKVIAMLCTMTLILTLAACGDSGSQNESSKAPGQSTQGQSDADEQSSSGEEVVGPGSITYPLDTDISISYWNGAYYSNEYQSWEESPAHQNFLEAVGVDIDFQHLHLPAGSTEMQEFGLLLADKKLPTCMYFNLSNMTSSYAGQLIADGKLYDLTDYLPKYAPDFWEYINQPEQEVELKTISTADGAIFGIPNLYETYYGANYIGPIIRQDWLDECGLSTPVTLEDWENVLVTFKEKYNAKFGAPLYRIEAQGLASGTDALGFLTAELCVNDDGKIVIPQIEPEWKELMETLSRWWDMGLIDEDSLTMDGATYRNKALSGEIGIAFTALSDFTNFMNDAKNEGVESEWVALSYPRTEAGNPTSMIQTRANRSTNVVVFGATSSEEELAVALQVWNYAFTEEGIKHMAYGVEGVSYTEDANGEIQWVDSIKNGTLGIHAESQKYSLMANGGLPGILLDRMVVLKNAPEVGAAPYLWTENTEAESHYALLTRTEDENAVHSAYWNAISTYVKEEATKFLSGKRSLDEYDAFVEALYEMGLQEVLDANQSAYERFNGQ